MNSGSHGGPSVKILGEKRERGGAHVLKERAWQLYFEGQTGRQEGSHPTDQNVTIAEKALCAIKTLILRRSRLTKQKHGWAHNFAATFLIAGFHSLETARSKKKTQTSVACYCFIVHEQIIHA
ncbi:hypothetical protein PoB_007468600 [Plakobranchus ocellatus]|uniref:Uncharacterized protein n=1 Tax=Plakobranchus ocellatus TaxID=259542 RepID=A0AAV4DWH4_9GAST|nr:hypothetical protein PoB_007468600 [Plakobranchus ocellatus]